MTTWLCAACDKPITSCGTVLKTWEHVEPVLSHRAVPKDPEYFVLRVNDEDVVLDGDAFLHGIVRSAFGMSEQCEGCGQDIVEVGKVINESSIVRKVRCGGCKADYDVKPGRMVGDFVRDLDDI